MRALMEVAAYNEAVATLEGWDLSAPEAAAAQFAGALEPEAWQEARVMMTAALKIVRAYERAHQLPRSQWAFDGTRANGGDTREY